MSDKTNSNTFSEDVEFNAALGWLTPCQCRLPLGLALLLNAANVTSSTTGAARNRPLSLSLISGQD